MPTEAKPNAKAKPAKKTKAAEAPVKQKGEKMPEPVTSPVSAPEPASLTSEIEEKEESKVNAQGVSVKKIKGPRPHGKTKFK